MTDRRAAFFLAAAVACFVLTSVAEAEHRWLSMTLGGVYVVLAVLSSLDARSRSRR